MQVNAIAAAAALVFSAAASAAVPFADVVVLMDESGSMVGEQAWMRGVVPQLDAGLQLRGLADNQFGLIGFGADAAKGPSYVRAFSLGGAQMGSASSWVTASAGLVTIGAVEDGWAAIAATGSYNLRNQAARNFILVTDEDRDNTNANLSFTSTLGYLQSSKALLNVVAPIDLRCGNGSRALGVIGTVGFQADGRGGYATCTNALTTMNNTIRTQYVDLALASGGGAWDLNALRSGGTSAQSFTTAFLDGKISEIIIQPPPVPEPSTYLLMALGLGAVILRRRLLPA